MSERTLGQTMAEYLEHLKTEGKSERTLYTYGQDAKQITSFFGAERRLSAILVPHVGKFLKSDALLKLPNGNERAAPTVRKTVRVLRMFFVWALDMGYIDKLPLPKPALRLVEGNMPVGRSAGSPEHVGVDNAACQTD
jgi:site-specific recombinase XerD